MVDGMILHNGMVGLLAARCIQRAQCVTGDGTGSVEEVTMPTQDSMVQ